MAQDRKTAATQPRNPSALSLLDLAGLEQSATIWVAAIGSRAQVKIFLTHREAVEWAEATTRALRKNERLAHDLTEINGKGQRSIHFHTEQFNLAGYVSRGRSWKERPGFFQGIVQALAEEGVPCFVIFGLLTCAGFGAAMLILDLIKLF